MTNEVNSISSEVFDNNANIEPIIRLRQMSVRVTLFDRAWFLHQLPRVIEAANYSNRMRLAGVPDKVRLKILRRWRPGPYFYRKEIEQLVHDMRSRQILFDNPLKDVE